MSFKVLYLARVTNPVVILMIMTRRTDKTPCKKQKFENLLPHAIWASCAAQTEYKSGTAWSTAEMLSQYESLICIYLFIYNLLHTRNLYRKKDRHKQGIHTCMLIGETIK